MCARRGCSGGRKETYRNTTSPYSLSAMSATIILYYSIAKSVHIGSRGWRMDEPVEVIKEREEVKQKPAETLCLVIWKCSEDFRGVIHMVFVSDSGKVMSELSISVDG
jgi:hypothetical protein